MLQVTQVSERRSETIVAESQHCMPLIMFQIGGLNRTRRHGGWEVKMLWVNDTKLSVTLHVTMSNTVVITTSMPAGFRMPGLFTFHWNVVSAPS